MGGQTDQAGVASSPSNPLSGTWQPGTRVACTSTVRYSPSRDLHTGRAGDAGPCRVQPGSAMPCLLALSCVCSCSHCPPARARPSRAALGAMQPKPQGVAQLLACKKPGPCRRIRCQARVLCVCVRVRVPIDRPATRQEVSLCRAAELTIFAWVKAEGDGFGGLCPAIYVIRRRKTAAVTCRQVGQCIMEIALHKRRKKN